MEALWIALAGFGGVLLGGWLDRRRERWRWKMDGRRRSYLALHRRLDAFLHSGDLYAEAAKQADLTDRELDMMFGGMDRDARELLAAADEVGVFGSPEMRALADEVIGATWESKTTEGPQGFAKAWSSPDEDGDFSGYYYSFVDYLDQVLKHARKEVALRGLGERWVDWRASRRAKRQRKEALAELEGDDKSS